MNTEACHSGRRIAVFALCAIGLAITGPSSAGETQTIPVAPLQIFLPPVPPVLWTTHPTAANAAPEKSPAPSGLAVFVTEPFYAPLSTRMAKSEIGDDFAFRLDTYRSERATLLAELRARIDTLRDADPASRQRALEDFSGEQTPRISALEKEAEAIRNDLSHHGSGFAEFERWRSGLASLPPGALTPEVRRQFVQVSAFYSERLSPAQRRLLKSIAASSTDEPVPPGGNIGSLLDFSPETARIRLPSKLPHELADQIVAYWNGKKELEHELLKTLYPDKTPSSHRAYLDSLQSLAVIQAPRLAALETQAEKIREGLATLNDPAKTPDLPDLPVELTARIAAHRADKLALNKALLARRDEVMKSAAGADAAALAEKVRVAIADFSREHASQYATLETSGAAIRGDLARLPGASVDSAAALLIKFSESIQRLQNFWDYRDYQTAVLQPGLSPEQRRLLFEGALEKLALPLPGATLKIMGNPKSP